MKAAVLRSPGEPLQIEELTLDEPGVGEVRVRVVAAGVCHSDLHYMSGHLSAKLPIVVGHEGAGIVEAVGPGGDGRIAVGQRVAFLWRPRCGSCEACLAGNPVLCRFGRVYATGNGLMDGTTRLRDAGGATVHHLMGVSCFAEQVVVSQTSLIAVPDGVPLEIAAISACAVITGVGAAFHLLGGAAGKPVAVVGAGGVGLAAIMGSALIGASPIIAVDIDPKKLALAERLGAAITIDASQGDVVERIVEATGGGAAWTIDAVGRPQTMQQSVAALRPGGTAVAVGLASADETFAVPVNDLVQRQKRIVGALYGSSNPQLDLPRIFDLYLAGRLPLGELLGERRPLAEVNEAYADLKAGAIGRGILVPEGVGSLS